MTLEFQEIKQQMSKITSDESKQPVIHPTLTRKPGYIKQGTLKKDKERKKKKGWPFPVINKYTERDMVFQVKPGAATYSEAVQQNKKVAIICYSKPKSVNLREIKRKLERR